VLTAPGAEITAYRRTVLLGGGFNAGAVHRSGFLAVMLFAGLHLRGGAGLGARGRGWRGRCRRGRCLRCQDGSYTQERGENKFVHLVLLFRERFISASHNHLAAGSQNNR
jgi:hypothetical protein